MRGHGGERTRRLSDRTCRREKIKAQGQNMEERGHEDWVTGHGGERT